MFVHQTAIADRESKTAASEQLQSEFRCTRGVFDESPALGPPASPVCSVQIKEEDPCERNRKEQAVCLLKRKDRPTTVIPALERDVLLFFRDSHSYLLLKESSTSRSLEQSLLTDHSNVCSEYACAAHGKGGMQVLIVDQAVEVTHYSVNRSPNPVFAVKARPL